MTAPTEDAAPLGFPETGKGLKGGALGLVSSVVVGTASTAPAYSLAASLGFVVAGGGAILAGVMAPAIILLAFVPMYLIAVAYQELNRAEPDCGTTFTWAARAFGPITGWLGGWGIIAADVIVMANLAQIAGAYSFTFVADLGWEAVGDLASNTLWTTVAGLLWIAIMTYLCYRGIEVSARIQYVLLAIEVAVLIMFSVVALGKVYSGNAESYSLIPSWDWFWPGGLSVADVIAPALLTAVFIYWGWDTAVSVNEESDDPAKTPGRAAILSTVLLLVTYTLVSTAAVAFAGVGTTGIGLGNPDNADDDDRGGALRRQGVLGGVADRQLADAGGDDALHVLGDAEPSEPLLEGGLVVGGHLPILPHLTARSSAPCLGMAEIRWSPGRNGLACYCPQQDA